MSERMRKIVARAAGTGEQVPAALYFAVEAIGVLAEEVDALCELLAPGSTAGPAPVPAPITHEAAVAKLRGRRFDWMKEAGATIVDPSDRHLTYQPGCCHGWIEISGESGLVGPVVVRVDSGFPLHFPSLADLVAHLGEEAP
jgi:hypothetical protein